MKRILLLVAMSTAIVSATRGQMLVNSTAALADGRTLTVQTQRNAVQLQNGDAFDAYIIISGVSGETGQTQRDWIEVVAVPYAGGSAQALIQASMLSGLSVAMGYISVDKAISTMQQTNGIQLTFKHMLSPATTFNAATKQAITSVVVGLANLAGGSNNLDINLSVAQALAIPNACATSDGTTTL
jgi:hypothetical protein